MDAGVPIKAPVAGISCGLITDGRSDETTMIDIQGVEDFYGDMDFKVAGTHEGHHRDPGGPQGRRPYPGDHQAGVRRSTHKARYYILDEVMLKAIPAAA